MRQKLLCAALGVEMAAYAVFHLSGMSAGAGFAAAAFPFVQIGMGLRALSLSGAFGNTVAIALYTALGLLPVGYLALRAARGRARAEDGLLALLSAVLFAVLYWMVNPADIAARFGAAELLGSYQAMLGLTVYGIVAGYLILRALRRVEAGTAGTLLRALEGLLALLCAVLVYAVFGAGIGALRGAWAALGAGNTGIAAAELAPSYAFLILQFLVDALPYVLGLWVVFSAFHLLDALSEDFYAEEAAPRAGRTARLCRAVVAAVLLSRIGVNCLQLLSGMSVRAGHYTLSVPLLPLGLAFAAMLLAQYFEAAKRLKDDNDMFI